MQYYIGSNFNLQKLWLSYFVEIVVKVEQVYCC